MATEVTGNKRFWGMIIYEITGDGTLHGLWKNNALSNDSILNEIARKKDNSPDLDGTYTSVWIEENNLAHTGILTISLIQRDTAFSFIWQKDGKEVFRGMGMPIGLTRIAVTYWNTKGALNLRF